MYTKPVTLVHEPTIVVLADMQIHDKGLEQLHEWLKQTRPKEVANCDTPRSLLPHNFSSSYSDNELLVEVAGRKCYDSFGAAAGRKTNEDYIANVMGDPTVGKLPHLSVLYHAKMTFFFAGISRRVTHELIRHYVGSDRDEEGSPSQESTRYTIHPGMFTVHPRDLAEPEDEYERYRQDMQTAYDSYLAYIERAVTAHKAQHNIVPKGLHKKRILEAAAQRLPGSAATSLIWTTNPVALRKFYVERCDQASDLEMQRFARAVRATCWAMWPNLFPESNDAVEWAHRDNTP